MVRTWAIATGIKGRRPALAGRRPHLGSATPNWGIVTINDTLLVSNVPVLSEITPYLTPMGSTDSILPVVTVTATGWWRVVERDGHTDRHVDGQ